MNILLLNGGKKFGRSQGLLNLTLQNMAKEHLTQMQHSIQETHIDKGYDIGLEIEKFLWMDVVIWQMPVWWMGEPWIVKKYIDEVFSSGRGLLFVNDGRHSNNIPLGYGTGGLMTGKKHMLSLTWNAPIEAFTQPGEFFETVGVDGLYEHFHKINEFIGINHRLPTFMCNDVVQTPNIPKYIEDYRKHLTKIFGS